MRAQVKNSKVRAKVGFCGEDYQIPILQEAQISPKAITVTVCLYLGHFHLVRTQLHGQGGPESVHPSLGRSYSILTRPLLRLGLQRLRWGRRSQVELCPQILPALLPDSSPCAAIRALPESADLYHRLSKLCSLPHKLRQLRIKLFRPHLNVLRGRDLYLHMIQTPVSDTSTMRSQVLI